ncbi:MAG: transposase [Bacteroidetes bacterium]|nr:transposase [Bacteroidota bacterium]
MRFPRKLAKDAIYHVTARANLQEYILKSKKIKDLFMTVIEMANMKFNFELINFSVMDNHVHLLIKPIGNPKNLSKIMQWILSVFAIRFNKKFKKKVMSGMIVFIAVLLSQQNT